MFFFKSTNFLMVVLRGYFIEKKTEEYSMTYYTILCEHKINKLF